MKIEISNYIEYRGKCKEMSEELVKNDSSLRLVRGYYYEPLWSKEEPHWWCVKPNGDIVDPTRLQFPSSGIVEFYREFQGVINCEECGKETHEDDAVIYGSYACCSCYCMCRMIGI